MSDIWNRTETRRVEGDITYINVSSDNLSYVKSYDKNITMSLQFVKMDVSLAQKKQEVAIAGVL